MTKDDDRTSDQVLVRALLKTGDKRAGRELCVRIESYVKPRLRVLTARQSRAQAPAVLLDDVIQEFWAIVFKNRAELLKKWEPDRGALKPYMSTIATNAMLNVVAKGQRRARNEQPEELIDNSPTPALAETRTIAKDLVAWIFSSLTPRDQEMAIAYFGDGRTAKEVAADFQTTEHAVHVWASRFKRRLKDSEEPSDE